VSKKFPSTTSACTASTAKESLKLKRRGSLRTIKILRYQPSLNLSHFLRWSEIKINLKNVGSNK
jgi:hypothetical protein